MTYDYHSYETAVTLLSNSSYPAISISYPAVKQQLPSYQHQLPSYQRQLPSCQKAATQLYTVDPTDLSMDEDE